MAMGARVLIADGNYPFSTGVPPTAKKVFLNLAPGILKVTEVLAIIAEHIPVEDAMLVGSAGWFGSTNT
jgi:L-fucose mutarotase